MSAVFSRVAAPVFSAALFSGIAVGQTVPLDRNWWQQAHHAEKTGFVLGFFDCSRAPAYVHGATSDDYLRFVDDQVTPASESHGLIPEILRKAERGIKARSVLKRGEEYSEKHGWLDGEWWGDATHGNPEEKIGYVECYLACESRRVDILHVHRYVDVLDLHFSSIRNEHDKIANILQAQLDREKTKS